MGELVLITGASNGLGLSAAVECAARGHRVVATMRSLERRTGLLEAARARNVAVSGSGQGPGSIDVEQLDVTADGAAAKVRELTLKYGPIFALVNSAGVALAGAFEEQPEADVREQFETNVFGLMAVTRAVLPSMRAARRGRIINISSTAGRVGFPMLGAYAATKHAVEGLSESLRWEVEPFGIEVCLVEPGTFKTGRALAFSAVGPSRPPASGRASSPPSQRAPLSAPPPSPYAPLAATVEEAVRDETEKAPPPDAVGQAIAALVDNPAPRFRSLVGIDARTLVTLRRMVPDRLFASGIRRLLRLPRSR